MTTAALRRLYPLALSALLGACAAEAPAAWSPQPLTVMTFNTGTSEQLPHDQAPDDGYGVAQALISDEHYGDGLAWQATVEATRGWFADVNEARGPVDLVGLQEIFFSERCADIPSAARVGFVCESWQPGDLTVARYVLGDGYQVVCHPGKPDKCVAVRSAWGRVRGCAEDFCLSGGVGVTVPGCGSGSRVTRFVIDLAAGGSLTAVHIHGSSGLSAKDQGCRLKQFQALTGAMDDGEPGLNGRAHVVLGDLNTDPHRFAAADPSAAWWAELPSASSTEQPLEFVSQVGEEARPTYGGVVNIDHVLADLWTGDCWSAGVTPQTAPVWSGVYFDHSPMICDLTPR